MSRNEPPLSTAANAASAAGRYAIVAAGATARNYAIAFIDGTLTLVPEQNLVSILITPVTAFADAGGNQQFSATGTYSDGLVVDLTSAVTWNSADQTVADITSGGLASALTLGASVISATHSGVAGLSRLIVTPTSPSESFTNVTNVEVSAGPATLYPSTIHVSGLPGMIAKVTVRLFGITHAWPDDLDILLVSPVARRLSSCPIAALPSG